MYRSLNAEKIVTTLEILHSRIEERFPDSGLGRVARETLTLASRISPELEALGRPNWPIRLGVAALILVFLILVAGVIRSVDVSMEVGRITDLLQGVDAAVNEVVLLGIAVVFLVTLEGRIRRRRALRALHELRSIAHVIDMHQLTKDPGQILVPSAPTASSPRRVMARMELARYLDYCSELLSLTSKVAALYAQYVNDPVVLSAVNDVESLTAALSQKIWQKIMILDTAQGHPAGRGAAPLG